MSDTVSRSSVSLEADITRKSGYRLWWIWGLALFVFVIFWQFGKPYAQWAFKVPRDLRIPAKRWISDFVSSMYKLFSIATAAWLAKICKMPISSTRNAFPSLLTLFSFRRRLALTNLSLALQFFWGPSTKGD